jgi:hypothetical protein
MSETITIVSVQQEYLDFMALEPGTYKRFQYYKDIQSTEFFEANITKKNGMIYYSYLSFTVKRSKDSYYRKPKKKHGFTLDDKGKLKIWFGTDVKALPFLHQVILALGHNWFNNIQCMNIMTKGLLEKVLNGKITNLLDYVKAYTKVCRINCSPKLLLQAIEKRNLNVININQHKSIAKDFNHYLECILNDSWSSNTITFLMDIERQAAILDRKIDYKWSKRRLEEEHTKWTKEIMELEVSNMNDEHLQWLDKYLPLMPQGFKLLSTQKEIFAEGKIMSHCVYTNYWNSVKAKRYIVIHVELLDQSATLGLNVNDSIWLDSSELQFNQLYGKYNKAVSQELHNYVHDWLKEINLHLQNTVNKVA